MKITRVPLVASMELDPESQTTVYRDSVGLVLPMGKHRKTYGPPRTRYDYDALSYSVIDSPATLATALHRYLDRFGLAFGCFDFGLTSTGDWVFFECNPNGQWGWLEPATGLPITATVADLLQKGIIDD